MHEEAMRSEREPWPLRPALLAALGLVAGLAVHAIVGDNWAHGVSALQGASAVFLTVLAGLVAFTLERLRWTWSLGFACACAIITALLFYWSGNTSSWSAAEGWRMVSLFLSIAIAAPLFQTARDAGTRRFAYPQIYDHAWTNVVLWCAGWGFVGVAFLTTVLLANLFGLIGIDFIHHLLDKQWFDFALGGASYGASVGVFREREGVVRLARRVLAAVLSVLAPVLGAGLLLFLIALPFTGVQALWDATKATTPILLACVIGSLVLANIVLGSEAEEEARNPALRVGAMALGLVVLPLAILAAVATGLRIGQYGFTPERLWALVFVVLATVCGVAYLVDLIRGRMAWGERVRPTNRTLAFVLCGAALLLATPLFSFNAISTRDQVARLESGRIKPEKFDWAALGFDFGEPGRAALKRLMASKDPNVRKLAGETAKADSRWAAVNPESRDDARNTLIANVRVLPAGAKLPVGLPDAMAKEYGCGGVARCTVVLTSPAEAILLNDGCFSDPETGNSNEDPHASVHWRCMPVLRFVLIGAQWWQVRDTNTHVATKADADKVTAAYGAGQIEVRNVQARRVFVGGVPAGDPFE